MTKKLTRHDLVAEWCEKNKPLTIKQGYEKAEDFFYGNVCVNTIRQGVRIYFNKKETGIKR